MKNENKKIELKWKKLELETKKFQAEKNFI
jgi:hypothetical protein